MPRINFSQVGDIGDYDPLPEGTYRCTRGRRCSTIWCLTPRA
jgi:hypothetical protein